MLTDFPHIILRRGVEAGEAPPEERALFQPSFAKKMYPGTSFFLLPSENILVVESSTAGSDQGSHSTGTTFSMESFDS